VSFSSRENAQFQRWRRDGSVVLDALCGQLGDDVVEVVGVGVAVSAVVADARLVVDLVPDDRVGFTGRHRCSDGERQTTTPRLRQQLQHLIAHQQ